MCYLWENGWKWIQSQRCLAFLGQWSWRRFSQRWERAVCGPPQRVQKCNTVCFYQEELFVLRRGRWPRPWILWRDGGDKKWQKKVQVEEDPEKSDSTGNGEAWPPLYTCRFPCRPLWGVRSCTGLIYCEVHPQVYSSRSKVVLVSKHSSQDWSCGLERKRKIKLSYKTDIYWMKCYTFEFNFGQMVPCSQKNPYFDIHKSSVGTGCVSTTQLICKQNTSNEVVFLLWVSLQGKNILDVKRL